MQRLVFKSASFLGYQQALWGHFDQPHEVRYSLSFVKVYVYNVGTFYEVFLSNQLFNLSPWWKNKAFSLLFHERDFDNNYWKF